MRDPEGQHPTMKASLCQGICRLLLLSAVICVQVAQAALKPLAPRQSLSLNGTWQIEQGDMAAPPARFTRTVSVPGLVDLAVPAFTEVGQVSVQRQAFWYRRSFHVAGSVPEIALLKLHKARYGVAVWLNGQLLGQHLPCFTPVEFDARPLLRPGENEVLIRLGANRESLPTDQPTGWDFEKYLFTPGLYDTVELILSGAPYLRNVQTVPDPIAKTVRIVAEVVAGIQPAEFTLRTEIVAAKSGVSATGAVSPAVRLAAGEQKLLDFVIPLPEGHLWTPEDPFLYELRLATGADAASVRFGLRSFRFDPITRRPLLNEQPYYLRGSNITLERFYEDAARADLPWQADWVRQLHRQIKAMNWNSLRYSIGFPPEFWYDIADEEGILIQDEFPVWLLNPSRKPVTGKQSPENPIAAKLIPEYTAWMRERWNHACVVIWDAQNESLSAETGKARDAVRHLDLSNRPWDNGWGLPGGPNDCLESHPYLFLRIWNNGRPNPGKPFFLSEISTTSLKPKVRPEQDKLTNPIIINEYDWLWLTREGDPTCLTTHVYSSLLGVDSTVDQRRLLHARYVAALTEFWRCHRQAAGVLHFCSLGYSRDGSKPRPEGGATSDDWIDVRTLRYEPYFAEYVKEAFAPVGLMLDFWAETLTAGERREMPVIIINDLSGEWSGQLRLRLLRGSEVVSEQVQACAVAGYGDSHLRFAFTAPETTGAYTLEAALIRPDSSPTRSLRDVKVMRTNPGASP
jgi:hypothetical protein